MLDLICGPHTLVSIISFENITVVAAMCSYLKPIQSSKLISLFGLQLVLMHHLSILFVFLIGTDVPGSLKLCVRKASSNNNSNDNF